MRTILEHQKKINGDLSGLSLVQKALFLCAICQRQVPVYEKFSVGCAWGDYAGLEALMKKCWGWAISLGRSSKPIEPVPGQFIDVDFGQSSSGLAMEAFSSVEYLVSLISSEVSDVSVPPVEYAFTILDGYLYERLELPVTEVNDRLVDGNQLVVREMSRQNEQLSMVASADWKMVDWIGFRRGVEMQSLLD